MVEQPLSAHHDERLRERPVYLSPEDMEILCGCAGDDHDQVVTPLAIGLESEKGSRVRGLIGQRKVRGCVGAWVDGLVR